MPKVNLPKMRKLAREAQNHSGDVALREQRRAEYVKEVAKTMIGGFSKSDLIDFFNANAPQVIAGIISGFSEEHRIEALKLVPRNKLEQVKRFLV